MNGFLHIEQHRTCPDRPGGELPAACEMARTSGLFRVRDGGMENYRMKKDGNEAPQLIRNHYMRQ